MQTIVVAPRRAVGGESVLLGILALPQMLRLGYDKRLSIGVVCAGGALGTMMPPSIVLIIYGLIASVSIAELFTAAITPAVILMGSYIAYVLVRCLKNPAMGPPLTAETQDNPFASKLEAVKAILLPGMIAFLVLGTIYGGIASVTEAAAMGVFGVMLAIVLRGEFNIAILHHSLGQTLYTCGMIIWIGIGAAALVGVYNLMGGNRFVSGMILGLEVAPIVIILVMMAIMLVLGLFLDWIGIAMLALPIFLPIVTQLGYDPIWFGILFAVNMQVSFLSPPFGPAAFYLKSVAPPEISLKDIYVSVLPFMAIQLLVLAALLTWPQLAIWPL